eukprot:1630162-Pyramimonas_sp.AAC.1
MTRWLPTAHNFCVHLTQEACPQKRVSAERFCLTIPISCYNERQAGCAQRLEQRGNQINVAYHPYTADGVDGGQQHLRPSQHDAQEEEPGFVELVVREVLYAGNVT